MVELALSEIENKIKSIDYTSFDLIIGIETGGKFPAQMIADYANISVEFIKLNYRDENNEPRYEEPVSFGEILEIDENSKVLLVDDVSVSGKTLNVAKKLLGHQNITTLCLKGKNADIVLFPEVKECVLWPWKIKNSVQT